MSRSRIGTRIGLGLAIGVFSALCAVQAPAAFAEENGDGSVSCTITENGDSGSGVISVQKDGKEVATETCGKALSVPAGTYTAVLRLDGALDGPEQSQPLTVKKGASTELKADFSTGTLEVKIASQGKRAAGMAIIKRDGKQIGTLGSGVTAHLSVGSYDVVTRYRTQDKSFNAVQVTRGQLVTLDAAFD